VVTRESGQMAQHGKTQSGDVVDVVNAWIECSEYEQRPDECTHADDSEDHREHHA
jgi:hypothetical protein